MNKYCISFTNSVLLFQFVSDAEAASVRPSLSSPFAKPEFLAKMAMDPRGRSLMGQPDFMTMLRDVQVNPSNMSKYIQDPRFQIVRQEIRTCFQGPSNVPSCKYTFCQKSIIPFCL